MDDGTDQPGPFHVDPRVGAWEWRLAPTRAVGGQQARTDANEVVTVALRGSGSGHQEASKKHVDASRAGLRAVEPAGHLAPRRRGGPTRPGIAHERRSLHQRGSPDIQAGSIGHV